MTDIPEAANIRTKLALNDIMSAQKLTAMLSDKITAASSFPIIVSGHQNFGSVSQDILKGVIKVFAAKGWKISYRSDQYDGESITIDFA